MAAANMKAPSAPSARPVSGKASEEFVALKRSLNEIASWEISPNSWDKIQINYAERRGKEPEARAFLKAIQLATPEM
jgi:hypothetical protein